MRCTIITIINREFKCVAAKKVRFSTILPRRDSYDDEILKSMKEDGVQLPLIVRPLPNNPEEYELINGGMRHSTLKDDDSVCIDVRYGLKDSDVFKISDVTFKRKQRNTYKRADFYDRWVQVASREFGEKGAQTRVAKEARLTEGGISQYLAIHKMFVILERLPQSAAIDFDVLKNQSINKLYELSKLTEDSVGLLRIAQQLAEHPEIPVRDLRQMVKQELESKILRLADDESHEAEDLQKIDIAQVAKLAQEIMTIANATKKNLEFFETRIKLTPESFLKSEILEELQSLQRRFKRLQKDTANLPERVMPRVFQN